MIVENDFGKLLGRIGWIAGFLALGAVLFVGHVAAQEAVDETPESTVVATPPADQPYVHLEVIQDEEGPVGKGDTFQLNVMVSNVENLSAFTFEVGFDPDRVRPVAREGQDIDPTPFEGTPSDDVVENILVEGDTGQFLAESPRNSICTGPSVRNQVASTVTGGCAGVSLPVCLGGPPGVSGSGVLATIVFESRGGESTQLALGSAVLTSDDAEPPCDIDNPGELVPILIEHVNGPPVTVELSGGGSSSLLLIVIVIAVVVLVVGAGIGGYLYYRQRSASV